MKIEIASCPSCKTQNFNEICSEILGGYLINHMCKYRIIKYMIAFETKEEAINKWNEIIERIEKKENNNA